MRYVLLLASLAACSSKTSTTDAGDAPECTAIVEACHPKDPGTGQIHECHEAAEKNVAADCKAKQAACVALCNAAPAPTTDAGADGADGAR